MVLVDGYVHSPSAGGDGLASFAVQQGQIRRSAAARGWRVGRMFDECSLYLALERIESRESDGLVVARLAHLGTSLEDAVVAIERIQAAGGRFLSIGDGIDLSTASGRLVLRILLSLNDRNRNRSPR